MKKLIAIALLLSITYIGQSQQLTSRLSESKMTISGTSTLHDWESDVEEFNSTANLEKGKVVSASFTAKVKSIKSGKSSMDENTYEAMKAEQFPKIKFTTQNIEPNGEGVNISGDLTIAGTTKEIHFKVNIEQWSKESMVVSGFHTFKMSEFGIEPPTAVFGTIKTGDKITINFELTYYQ